VRSPPFLSLSSISNQTRRPSIYTRLSYYLYRLPPELSEALSGWIHLPLAASILSVHRIFPPENCSAPSPPSFRPRSRLSLLVFTLIPLGRKSASKPLAPYTPPSPSRSWALGDVIVGCPAIHTLKSSGGRSDPSSSILPPISVPGVPTHPALTPSSALR